MTQARLLAPAALAAFAIAFFTVVLSSGTGGGEGAGGERTEPADRRPATGTQPARRRTPAAPAADTYTVKTGDTLGGIAQSTGVPVERLQELNPELDPQALVSGQKIKLRE